MVFILTIASRHGLYQYLAIVNNLNTQQLFKNNIHDTIIPQSQQLRCIAFIDSDL